MRTPGDDSLDVRIAAKAFRAPAGSRAVLRDIGFTADAGEFVALFGPSGMGKSTTLRIVLGLDTDFTGAVQRPSGPVGVMFQEPRLLPWLTVAENLLLVVPEGAPEPDVPALLEEVGLPGAARRWPRELSLGMARRASLARALCVAPRLLVLDEPFASLDKLLAARLAGVVARQARPRGATVLLAIHELDQVLPFADRILVLSGQPATLAADIAVPQGADPATLAALKQELLERFPFLGVAAAEEAQE